METDGLSSGKRHVFRTILIVLIALIALYLIVQGVRCAAAIGDAEKRLAAYEPNTIALSYGGMTYVDRGKGEAILSVHGIFGGYDQAFDTLRDHTDNYRIIAPSRFGYPGSDLKGDGTPKEQAAAFAELLDFLELEQVYVLGTSAGGTPAIRFALDYPERTKGLILYSSAMPNDIKPDKFATYQGPPEALLSDYLMYLISPLFEPIMGMDPDTIYGMLPVNQRKEGAVIDASITNPDMARNFDAYPIESLQVPTLILQARDDKLVHVEMTEKAAPRFPNLTLIIFDKGGHLMEGHAGEINAALAAFIK